MPDERRQDGERRQAVEEAVQHHGSTAGPLSGGYGVVRDHLTAVDARTLVRQVGEVLEGVVEDGRSLTITTLGRRPVRRWPWAAGAAVAGALAGAGVAYAVRRVVGQDAPGALEPEQLRAVVDTALADGPPRA